MTFRCLDFETTSLPDEGEATGIMQSGWCDLRFGIIHPPKSVFVDCGIPVAIGARAIHHISDEMVAGEIKPDEACALLMEKMAKGEQLPDGDYFAAHNIDHEKHYFSGGEIPWCCTYKTALRVWPDAPGHKLQELRYFLQLDEEEDFDPKLADPPHRAPADAYVCAHLLRRILKEVTVEQMVRWSSGPALLYMCFMKKHKNEPWSEVARNDRPYLEWIVSDKCDLKDRDIRATVKYWLKKTAAPQAAGDPYHP